MQVLVASLADDAPRACDSALAAPPRHRPALPYPRGHARGLRLERRWDRDGDLTGHVSLLADKKNLVGGPVISGEKAEGSFAKNPHAQ